MKRLQLLFPLLVCVVAVGFNAGCIAVAGAAAGAGTVAYIRGELSADIDRKIEVVAKATNRAIPEVQLAKISEQKDVASAVFIARTREDTRVEIKLTRTTDTLTRVRIRVGIFGDEPLSRALLDRIREEL